MRGRILAFMAGAEAEHEIIGAPAIGDGDDRKQIDWMADSADSGIRREDWSRYEARLRRRCKTLVRRHRTAIERVAAGLLASGTLTPEQIDHSMAAELR